MGTPTKSPPVKAPSVQDQLNDLKQTQLQLKQEQERFRKKSTTENTLQMFEQTVFGRTEKWMMTARNIGSAYSRAAKLHRDALGGENENRALQKNLMFSVLTVLSVGSLSWVWEAQKLIRIGAVLGPVLKDSIATALGEGFDNGVALAPVSPFRDSVNQEPLDFQNDLQNRVSSFNLGARTFLFDVWKYIRSAPPESWDQVQVDRVQNMTEVWLRDATTVGVLDISAGDDKTIDQMAYEFERGFWQKWIFGLVTGTQDEYGYVSREYESIHTGGPVAKRLQALGILREAGVEIARYHEAVEEDRPLIAWARDKYKPRLFAAE